MELRASYTPPSPPPLPFGPTAILVAACWVVWGNDNFQRKSRGVCCVGRRGSFDEVQSVRGMALRTRDPWSEAAAEPLRGPMQGPALRGPPPTTSTHICKTYLTRFPLLKKSNRAATPLEPAIKKTKRARADLRVHRIVFFTRWPLERILRQQPLAVRITLLACRSLRILRILCVKASSWSMTSLTATAR